MNVDDYIDNPDFGLDPDSDYASWVLNMLRFPARLQNRFSVFMEQCPLYCNYGSKRYRITMASRFGDVGLNSDLDIDFGYDKRVKISDCRDLSMYKEYGHYPTVKELLKSVMKSRGLSCLSNDDRECACHIDHETHSDFEKCGGVKSNCIAMP